MLDQLEPILPATNSPQASPPPDSPGDNVSETADIVDPSFMDDNYEDVGVNFHVPGAEALPVNPDVADAPNSDDNDDSEGSDLDFSIHDNLAKDPNYKPSTSKANKPVGTPPQTRSRSGTRSTTPPPSLPPKAKNQDNIHNPFETPDPFKSKPRVPRS